MVQGKLSKQQVKSNYEAQFNKFYQYFYRILLYTEYIIWTPMECILLRWLFTEEIRTVGDYLLVHLGSCMCYECLRFCLRLNLSVNGRMTCVWLNCHSAVQKFSCLFLLKTAEHLEIRKLDI